MASDKYISPLVSEKNLTNFWVSPDSDSLDACDFEDFQNQALKLELSFDASANRNDDAL